jgi:transposase
MNQGKTLFAQVMEFVPWKTFNRIIERHQGDCGVRRLNCAELFRVLAFAQLSWRQSLRDIEASLGANRSKLFHMGIGGAPHRATMADALENRDWRIFHELAMRLITHARRLYADSPSVAGLDATVYALDSTTIDLCLSLFRWAPAARGTRAAIKLHTLLDLRGSIPVFIHVTPARVSDVRILDMLPIEAGSFYVMDRGYVDYRRLYRIHQAGAFFVTRAKQPMDARRVYSMPAAKETGVQCDQRIALNGFYAAQHYPEQLRRIRFHDAATAKTLVFLTNNTVLPAASIAGLYKSRWQVELFFKWIKQHLRIQHFLGTSANAVKSQVWSAIATYVLVAIVRKELGLTASLYTCLQVLSVSLFEKTQLLCALQPETYNSSNIEADNQLLLFDL